jgi:hypothetical protein
MPLRDFQVIMLSMTGPWSVPPSQVYVIESHKICLLSLGIRMEALQIYLN